MDSLSSNGRSMVPVQRPFLSLNGHGTSHTRIKPRVVNSKVPSRIRKAIADAAARQANGVAASQVTVKVGEDWGGMGHRATRNLPDDFLDDLSADESTDEVIRRLP